MKCERCGKELSDSDLYCSRCGKAVFPEYMDEEDIWAYYKSDEELEQILKEEEKESLMTGSGEADPGKAGTLRVDPDSEDPAEPLCLKEKTGSEKPESENLKTEDLKPEEPEPANLEKEDPECRETEPGNPEREAPKPQETEEPQCQEPGLQTAKTEESKPREPVPGTLGTEESKPQEPGLETSEPEALKPRGSGSETSESEALKFRESGSETSETEDLNPEISEGTIQEADLTSEKPSSSDLETDQEDEEQADFELEEEEEEEKEPLTPAKKRARRYTALLAGGFLLLCLAVGIFLGIRRMEQLDALEKAYDEKIEKSETASSKENAGNIRLLAEEPDLSQNTKLQPVSAQADSQKQSEEEDYSGNSLIDGNPATSWQEGEAGTGEGKGVTITLDGSHTVRYLVLYLGNWKSDELWNYNARPEALAVQVGEEEEEILEFPNEKTPFYLCLQEPAEASQIKIRIQSSYEGERWEDNCISEIEVYE